MEKRNDEAYGRSTGAKTLDLCCGTADWTLALGEDVGVDGEGIWLGFQSEYAVNRTRKNEAFKLNQVKLFHGNAMELPFEDDSFDYVTIGFGLRNVPDYLHVFKEMYRVVNREVWLFVLKPPNLLYLDSPALLSCISASLCLFRKTVCKEL